MMFAHQPKQAAPPAIARLVALEPLDEAAYTALGYALQRPRHIRAVREILSEGQEITETLLVVSGWAAAVRALEDGRRQIVKFILPGDLIGLCDHERPLASSAVIAISNVQLCPAPSPATSPALARAYAQSRALDGAHLLSQVVRLGRMNAYERIASLLLELLERLELAGLAEDGRYSMPLTQEIMADALGLTPVHVNRTLQTLRRDDVLDWKGREVVLRNAATLRSMVGHTPARVSAK